jgi:putative lipoprotein
MRGLVLVFALHLGQEHPRGDSWFGADKAKHFFMAAFVQSLSFGALRSAGLSRNASLTGATVTSTAASIGKEISDRASGGVVSLKDLTYDGAGILGATVLLRRTDR